MRAAEPLPVVDDELAEERFLVLEVPVEEALRHAGGMHDVDDAGLGVPALGEQLRRAIQELLLAFHALGGEPPVIVHVGAIMTRP